ncbi:MAG TPA: M56 family metallopeptidase [Draconibacterium sp.]|nr:M56 family metallopeptidase [Draconibacterium sp.]
MNSAINFLLESGVSLALLSLIYILFLRGETFFRLNRVFLLISVAFSILLPFMHFRVYEPQSVMLPEVTVTQYRNLVEAVTIYGQDVSGVLVKTISSSRIIVFIYLLGLLVFTIRFLMRVGQITLLISKNSVQKSGKVKFVLIEKEFSPFSFLNYVFINPGKRGEPAYQRIVKHELEHIRQGHSFDVLVLEVLTILQWFNPFMWILKKVIRENHEFLADRAVLNTGMSVLQYKQLLLNQVVGFQPVMANNFNSSLIKKRIKMISKIKSSKMANFKYIVGALSVVLLIVIFACEQKEVAEMPNTEKSVSLQLKLDGDKILISGDNTDLEKVEAIIKAGNITVSRDSLGNTFIWSNPNPQPEVTRQKTIDGEDVFFIVEEMPEFPGGDLALRKYIANSIKYPEIAQDKGIQGKVYVTFVVSKDGTVANARIARGVDPSLDKEALRVVSSLPQWKPGKQRGENVNVSYTVPINFVLQ